MRGTFVAGIAPSSTTSIILLLFVNQRDPSLYYFSMAIDSEKIIMEGNSKPIVNSNPPTENDQELGVASEYIDKAAERSYGGLLLHDSTTNTILMRDSSQAGLLPLALLIDYVLFQRC